MQWYGKISLETGTLTWTTIERRVDAAVVFEAFLAGHDVTGPHLSHDPLMVRQWMVGYPGYLRALRVKGGRTAGGPASSGTRPPRSRSSTLSCPTTPKTPPRRWVSRDGWPLAHSTCGSTGAVNCPAPGGPTPSMRPASGGSWPGWCSCRAGRAGRLRRPAGDADLAAEHPHGTPNQRDLHARPGPAHATEHPVQRNRRRSGRTRGQASHLQTKIDDAPGTIPADAGTVAIIGELQAWAKTWFAEHDALGKTPKYLFLAEKMNRNGDLPYPSAHCIST